MLLDIQNLFNEPRGGLSGLTKKILGAELNKTRRNRNWEQRPLTLEQLEYAALDAAVLSDILTCLGPFKTFWENQYQVEVSHCSSNGCFSKKWKELDSVTNEPTQLAL